MRTRTKTFRIIFAPRATGLGGAVRRAAMTLLVLMTTATAWASENHYCTNCGWDTPHIVISSEVTCTEGGMKVLECEACGLVISELLDALGHAWSGWTRVYATCTSPGGQQRTCNRCGATTIDYTEAYNEPALGHDWGEDTHVAATCTAEGGDRHTCNRCGVTDTDNIIPALGHDWDEYNICTRCNTPNGDIILADDTDNEGKIARLAALGSIDVTLQGRTLYCDGDWNTLCLPFSTTKTGPLAGTTIKELDTDGTYSGHKTGMEGSTLYLNFKDTESIVAGRPYIVKWNRITINSEADWNDFAEHVNDGTYSNMIVVLGAEISVSTMVGTADHPFSGTFCGGGHTLTFNGTATATDCAPFGYIDGATFKCLKVAGTISTGYKYAAGIAAHSYGICTIQNCQSSITVNSTINGDGTHAGFVAVQESGSLTITNCLFDGSISGSNTNNCGGFVGWRSNGSLTFTNCLMAGTMDIEQTNGSALYNRNGGSTLTNCYYDGSKSYGSIATQDATSTSASGSDLQALLGDGWQVSGSDVVPKMNIGIDDIVNPLFEGVSVTATEPTAVTSEDGKVTFVGNYDPFEIDDGNINKVIYLGSGNTVGYASAARTLRPFRAHFELSTTAGSRAMTRAIMNFGDGDGETTGIETPPLTPPLAGAGNSYYYTLDGRRLSGRPTAKGIYIHNGRKEVVR